VETRRSNRRSQLSTLTGGDAIFNCCLIREDKEHDLCAYFKVMDEDSFLFDVPA
jgi:hypothetical protein